MEQTGEHRVRPATDGDAAGVARVHVDSWRATYRGIVPDSFLGRMSYAEYERRFREYLRGSGVFRVAETREGEVVGFASGGAGREPPGPGYDCELYTIYLSPGSEGDGLGRVLFLTVAEGLRLEGYASMFCRVMEANEPAVQFYERLGGRRVGEHIFEIEGKEIEEASFGWSDLKGLQSPGSSGS